ncbi:MAG: hypothetical protein BGN98_10425 [Microbacterium sp. 69-7]|uniref:helix-turn-helix domain-containing protein n=1 Tax=Microbacterium sp. 69-7 TaxID=1895784 RepID=UPI000968B317|nr:helix-turn-helix domain-containing protein [Microbacterium sp. 69-7]OJU43622.1 MAG: hypothetical protein BGN98_10425 [Microbacterium sp. 69-7]
MPKISNRWLLRGGIAALNLTKEEALVLMYLVDRSDSYGVSFPSQVRMARELGCARSGVQNALGRLELVGALTVTAKIRGRSNGYRLNHIPRELAEKDPARHAHSLGTPPAHSAGQVVDNRPAHSLGTK